MLIKLKKSLKSILASASAQVKKNLFSKWQNSIYKSHSKDKERFFVGFDADNKLNPQGFTCFKSNRSQSNHNVIRINKTLEFDVSGRKHHRKMV